MAGRHRAEQASDTITIEIPARTLTIKVPKRVDLDDPEVQAAIRRGTLTRTGQPACQDAFCNDVRDHDYYGKPGHSWDGNPE